MEDDTAGSRKRGLFQDLSQEPLQKVARSLNPEYLAAFRAFDADGSGSIDLAELRRALQVVKQNLEASAILLFPREFQLTTCCWLCARFGDGFKLTDAQFCEALAYVRNLKDIFEQVDVDRSGSIECGELHRAFKLSGVDMPEELVAQVGRSYDADNSSKMEFDEFVQLRLEWDCYISCWDFAAQGSSTMHPERLLQVLEEIKKAMEPVGVVLQRQTNVPAFLQQGMFFTSQFKTHRPFQPQTCQWLIIRFGQGKLFLSFGQYAAMMVFLKEMKAAFCKVDVDSNGSLNVGELANLFTNAGLAMPPEVILQMARGFDRNGSGEIEFDEFVQMAVEWDEMLKEQARFTAQPSGRITAKDLQELLGSTRVLYRVRNNDVHGLRVFHRRACRCLVATFGSALPGEPFASSLTWGDFLNCIHYLKAAHSKYLQCDISKKTAASTQDLVLALAFYGIVLPAEVVQMIRCSFDEDGSGTFEFDEFIELLTECHLYEKVFEARLAQPSILTPLNSVSPLFGPSLAGGGTGLVALDKSAFFSMVFSVPRLL